MQVYALTPVRREPYPYAAYFAEGTLFLAPTVLAQYPNAVEILKAQSQTGPEGVPEGLVQILRDSHVVTETDGGLKWKASVHAPTPLADVRPMASGDFLV
jgi:hypothetical protein